jgi:aspartyl-tRNA(Asn)/glutamyl-tRNA(Gln) amidotransferase subunit C
MEINHELIKRISTVARIDLTDYEIEKYTTQLKDVFEYFKEIDSVDTQGLEPSFQPIKMRDSLREDIVKESISQESALKNSKHTKDGFFLGPKSV